MTRTYALCLVALASLAGCAQSGFYQPVSPPEQTEYAKDKPNVYPDDVRQDPARYLNKPVIWVGIIRSSDAQEEDTSSKMRVDTVFEQHYYNWKTTGGPLKISSRGEGRFRARWYLDRTSRYVDSTEVTPKDAQCYAAPGKLAIFYGVPESIDPDGTITMKYHYVRVLPEKAYTTNLVEYGRLGEADPSMILR